MIEAHDFLSKIENKKNQKLEALRRMKNSRLPLIIYGTGEYAKLLAEFLHGNNIQVNAACVDNDSSDNHNTFSDGIYVYPLEEIPFKFDYFNVLIGIADFKLAEKKLGNLTGCQNIFFLDSPLNFDSFDYNYIKNNIDAFLSVYNLLEDSISGDTMTAFLNAKISGRPDDLYNLVQSDRYFPSDIIKLSSEEVFIDAGANDGDTIIKLLDKTNGRYKTIYAFEPYKFSFNKLKEIIHKRGLQNIILYNKGVWDKKDKLKFNINSNARTMSAISQNGKNYIEVDTIDNLVDNFKATYIKMEVQGSAIKALNGAENTIKNSKPKIAVSVDYNPDDLITIPAFINRTAPGYKFYLRHYLYITHMLVLYAVYK